MTTTATSVGVRACREEWRAAPHPSPPRPCDPHTNPGPQKLPEEVGLDPPGRARAGARETKPCNAAAQDEGMET